MGKAMDMSSMFDMPIEMLAFLEGDISNPELYQRKLYEDTEVRATDFAKRVLYLQVIIMIIILIIIIIVIIIIISTVIRILMSVLLLLLLFILVLITITQYNHYILFSLSEPECFKMFE